MKKKTAEMKKRIKKLKQRVGDLELGQNALFSYVEQLMGEAYAPSPTSYVCKLEERVTALEHNWLNQRTQLGNAYKRIADLEFELYPEPAPAVEPVAKKVSREDAVVEEIQRIRGKHWLQDDEPWW